MNEPIKHNRIKCLKCGDIIESTHRHHFIWCSCGSCATDGGHDYQIVTGDKENWVIMSEYYEEKK